MFFTLPKDPPQAGMATSTTLGVSLAIGLAMFGLVTILGWLSNTYGWNANLLKWFVLPILGYGITLAINSLLQVLSCGTVNMAKLATGGLVVPGAILAGLVLTLAGIVRSPIQNAVPLAYRLQYGGLVALAYYMFWAGMFGEAFAGGFAQACN